MNKKSLGYEDLIGILISIAFLGASIYTINDYGITVDSPENFLWGSVYLRYFETFDRQYLSYETDENPMLENPGEPTNIFYYKIKYRPWMYPPVASILSAITHKIFHESLGWVSDIDGHHIAIIILSTITVFVLYKMVFETYGLLPAIIASISLSLYPRFIAHSHNNIKDAPMTCFFVFTIYCMWKATTTRQLNWSILSGVLLGLSLNVKINAYFIPLIFGLWLLFTYKGGKTQVDIPKYVIQKKGCLKIKRKTIEYPFLLNLAIILLLALSVVYLSWPYLWSDPVGGLNKSFNYFLNVGGDTPILYEGVLYGSAREVPLYYAPHYLLIVTPPTILLLVLLGFSHVSKSFVNNGLTGSRENNMSLLVVLWIGITLARTMIPGRVIYGGIRQFLEIVPPICIIAGIGGKVAYDHIKRRLDEDEIQSPKMISFLWMAILFAPLFINILYIHPYEIAYFNFIVGGTNGAYGRYEVGYWGTALKEAGEWVSARKSDEVGVFSPVWWHITNYYVNISTAPGHVNYVILQMDPSLMNVTWFREESQMLMMLVKDRNPVHRVEVDGVPLVNIYKVSCTELVTVMDFPVPPYYFCQGD